LKSKKHEKLLKKWRKIIWILLILLILCFVVMALIFRQSVKQISKDPSVTSLTNEGVFRIIQITNINKNRGEDCWNMKNPLNPCNVLNQLTEGNYALKGTAETKWLEHSASKSTKLSEDFIRETLGGFMMADLEYYQTIKITYTSDETMQVEVETTNNNGDTSYQLINLNAK